jgi:hypothetical protein
MPAFLDQAILDLVAAHPEALLTVLRERLRELPGDSELRSSDPLVNEAWRGRLAFELYGRGSPTPWAALTVQVQLEKDDDAPCSWLIDHVDRHLRLRVPSYLVVVTTDPTVAAWAAGPFDLGTSTMRPQVITLVELLEARGIALDSSLRERIGAGIDSDQIARWLRRATTTTVAEEVFTS